MIHTARRLSLRSGGSRPVGLGWLAHGGAAEAPVFGVRPSWGAVQTDSIGQLGKALSHLNI